jgi:hypothetical protein
VRRLIWLPIRTSKCVFCAHLRMFVLLKEALKIDESSLNTKRMLDMMAVSVDDGPVPLYLYTINRILREMRISQQEMGGGFNYRSFKDQVMAAGLSPAQLGPLNQRLENLESFMPRMQTALPLPGKKGKNVSGRSGTNFTPKVSCFQAYSMVRF